MRIAFVTPEYVTEPNFSGGLANYLHRVSLALLQLGHEPVVVVRSDRDESFVHRGIEVHRVRVKPGVCAKVFGRLTSHRYTASVNFFGASRALSRKVAALHGFRKISLVQYPHLGGMGVLRPRGIPAVVRLSSYLPLWRMHGEYDHSPPVVIRQQELWERYGLKRADAVFGPCGEVAAAVARDIGRPVEVIETPFVMDAETSDDSVYRDALDGKAYLLFVGRFSPAKGLVVLADAVRDLLARHPETYFALVGREMGGYRGAPMLDYVMERAGADRSRLLYLGDLVHEKLYPIMKRAAAVVVPSLIENFPNVCLEAMAHRKVVVGTRRTGLEQLITDGVSGILCDPGDPQSLLGAMERAMALPDRERERIGAKARERIDELRPEKAVVRLLSYYEKVIRETADMRRKGFGRLLRN